MRFWSVSTTIRSPERIRSFLKVLKEIDENFTYKQAMEYKGEVSPSLHTRLSACIPLPPLRGLHPRNAPTFVRYKLYFNRKVS